MDLKKLISYLTAVSLLVSSAALPVFAEEAAGTETETTLSVAQRVAEGLDQFQSGMETLERAKDVSVDDTLQRWDDYLKAYDDILASLSQVDEVQDILLAFEESRAASQGSSSENADEPNEETPDYEGLGIAEIPKEHISQMMYDAVKAAMPQKDWDEMDIEGENYQLRFIDNNIVIMTEILIEICEGEQVTVRDIIVLQDESQKPIFEAIEKTKQLVETLDKVLEKMRKFYNTEDVGKFIKDELKDTAKGALKDAALKYAQAGLLYPAKKTIERLYDVFFAMNERNRELAEIDAYMTQIGLWNVKNEETDVPTQSQSPDMTYPGDDADETPSIPKLVYNLGSGDDIYHIYDMEEPVYAIIAEDGMGESGNDTISFEYALSAENVQFVRNDGDLYINDLEHEVYLLIPENFSNKGKRIENIRFMDGTVLDFDAVCDIADVQIGTENNDTLNGYLQINHIFGMEGNDTVVGNQSNDDLYGFDGDDTLILNDRCYSMFGEAGNYFAYGMDGNDTIRLSFGNDFIWAGKGDDFIRSGAGEDIVYYELGDGNDIFDDTTGRSTYPHSGYDVLWLGEGILPDEVHVTLSKDQYEFVLHIMKTGHTITLPGNAISGATPVFPIEEIHFTDGTTWNRDALLEQVRTLYGTDGDDELYARVDTGVTIYGGTGNDKCYGKDGDDLFYGSKGDDYFRAGAGNDIFYYELGDGNDLIDSGNGRSSYPEEGKKVLSLGEGILPDEVMIERSLDDYTYILWINKTQECITMTGNVISGFSSRFPIKNIQFADGTTWDVSYLESNCIKRVIGTDGNDSLKDSDDNDTIYCGKGNDAIRGTSGDDLYIYELGDGRDTLLDNTIWGNGYNTLQFGEGIALEDLYQENTKHNNNKYTRLYIKDRNSFVQISGIHEIVFADGEPIKLADVLAQIPSATEITSEVPGDLSCDGIVSEDDISLMMDFLTTTLSISYLETADLNGDGVVNAADLSLLKQLCLSASAET